MKTILENKKTLINTFIVILFFLFLISIADLDNLREVFIKSIDNSSTSRIIWISKFDPSNEILKIKNLIYVLIDSDTDYLNTILELENAENIVRNLIDLKNV